MSHPVDFPRPAEERVPGTEPEAFHGRGEAFMTEPQTPEPNPNLKNLERLVSTWKVSGPDIDGNVTFEWMDGRRLFPDPTRGFRPGRTEDQGHGGHRTSPALWRRAEPGHYRGTFSEDGNSNSGAWVFSWRWRV